MIAIGGLVIGLVLILLARFDPGAFSILRGGALDVTAPASAGLRSGVRAGQSVADAIGNYVDAAAQNAALKAELASARRDIVTARAQSFELRRLKAVLKLVEPGEQPVAVARIVTSTAALPRRMATLTAGRLAGVESGQPVRSPEGLIGRVLETGATASRVMLLADEGNVVPVRIARDGTPALVSGTGSDQLDVKALAAGGTPFRRGDLLVTSGVGGLYPPGIPVAVVTAVNADTAVGWALASPARLDFAIVEPIYQTDLSQAPAATAARR